MKKIILFLIMVCILNISCKQTRKDSESIQITRISIKLTGQSAKIDPMIYGQMLEDCNDHIIYGGIINQDGGERPHVTELLKPLQIPVVRWPGGTFVLKYDWQNGIGPASSRPTVDDHIWGGKETHLFGTDEFLAWCNKVGTSPYINLNMGDGTLAKALNWIEYVNGGRESEYGRKREGNGHPEPYQVKYWGIGNENYYNEDPSTFADRLFLWAGTIHSQYPGIQLLTVGHTYDWNKIVLEKNGNLIDFLTQHYYVTSRVRNDVLQNPENSLFAPSKMEAHLIKVGELLKNINRDLGRQGNPIRISVDEWNNRHQVFNGTDYKFTRNDSRKQFDVAIAAGMLNVFIRQSSTVGMANYIFPVNGHGLIKTVGDNDAFRTPIYYVFELYRQLMVGNRADIQIDGPGLSASEIDLSIVGDLKEINLGNQTLNFIDGAAVLTTEGSINIALINRSPDKSQEIKLSLPKDYIPVKKWEIFHSDINATNGADKREEIMPKVTNIQDQGTSFVIPPCGLLIVNINNR